MSTVLWIIAYLMLGVACVVGLLLVAVAPVTHRVAAVAVIALVLGAIAFGQCGGVDAAARLEAHPAR